MKRLARCAIYTRQSVARPSGDFTSCDAQWDMCLARIRASAFQGWIALQERFGDLGESGATMDRPALKRLLERVAAREIDRVIVHRLDRLGAPAGALVGAHLSERLVADSPPILGE
jgi:DNA invertase Pin-like site-specific DNA recombinase